MGAAILTSRRGDLCKISKRLQCGSWAYSSPLVRPEDGRQRLHWLTTNENLGRSKGPLHWVRAQCVTCILPEDCARYAITSGLHIFLKSVPVFKQEWRTPTQNNSFALLQRNYTNNFSEVEFFHAFLQISKTLKERNMSRNILVGVTLGGDHEAYEGRKEKPSWPLLSVVGWIINTDPHPGWSFAGKQVPHNKDLEAFTKTVTDHGRRNYHIMRWLEECTVLDATPDQELPDELFVMVRSYQNNGSWYAKSAYMSKEKAEEVARQHSHYEWMWAIPCRRFVGSPEPSAGSITQWVLTHSPCRAIRKTD